MTARTSFTPAVIAESFHELAARRARTHIVPEWSYPAPGGPESPRTASWPSTRAGAHPSQQMLLSRTPRPCADAYTANGARDAERAERARGRGAREEGSFSGRTTRLYARLPSSGNSRSKREQLYSPRHDLRTCIQLRFSFAVIPAAGLGSCSSRGNRSQSTTRSCTARKNRRCPRGTNQ